MPYTPVNSTSVVHYMEHETPPRNITYSMYWDSITKSLVLHMLDAEYPIRTGM